MYKYMYVYMYVYTYILKHVKTHPQRRHLVGHGRHVPPQEHATARVLVTQAGVTLHTYKHTYKHTYILRT